MANAQLIKMAQDLGASKGFQDVGGAFTESFSRWVDEAGKDAQVAAAKHQESDARVVKFMESIPNGNISKIPTNAREGVSAFLTEQRKTYAAAAEATRNLEPGSVEYQEQVKVMNDVQQSFIQLDSEFTNLLEAKAEYLEAGENGEISLANDPDQRSVLDSVYTEMAGLSFSTEGNILFDNNGSPAAVSELPSWFGTEQGQDLHDSLLSTLDPYAQKGYEITGGLEDEVRNRVYSTLKKAGRKAVQSLAVDVAYGNAGEKGVALDDDLIRNPERYEELLDSVVSFWTESVKNSAKSVKEAEMGLLKEKKAINKTEKTPKYALDADFLIDNDTEATGTSDEESLLGPQLPQNNN